VRTAATLTLARKEALEILRTWRVVVLPAIVLLFAVTSPVLAKFTPEIVSAVAGAQFGDLVLPSPTAYAAYGQWIKNLSQIAAFAIIISSGGIVSAERRAGTAALVLTKSASREVFVLVKFAVHLVFLALVLAFGTTVAWAVTAVTFGSAPAGALWSSTAVWFALAGVYLGLMVLFSVLIPAAAGAAGAGLAAYVALAVGAAWPGIANHSPAGLLGRATTLAAHTDAAPVFWPVLTAAVVVVAAVAAAVFAFRRQEL
jgi:ABC-2 type transport system permease protein